MWGIEQAKITSGSYCHLHLAASLQFTDHTVIHPQHTMPVQVWTSSTFTWFRTRGLLLKYDVFDLHEKTLRPGVQHLCLPASVLSSCAQKPSSRAETSLKAWRNCEIVIKCYAAKALLDKHCFPYATNYISAVVGNKNLHFGVPGRKVFRRLPERYSVRGISEATWW